MYKYTCLNPIAKVGLDLFGADYEKTEGLNDADAVLVRSAAMHDMEMPTSLHAVARAGAGVNNIPIDRCSEDGIVVFNTPGANANGVKELVFAGMLLASRDIVGGIQWVEENKDAEDVAKQAEKAKKAFAGCELKGKKLGIIGLGAIGIRVANTARHFGMEVYGFDPYISVDSAWKLSRDIKHINQVEDIYRECDYITIHVPLLDSTKDMINEEAISMMKPNVVVLNFARDVLVDEPAMLQALEEGRVRKYVSDFPNPTTAGKPGVIVMPHIGASTAESEDNCAVMAVKELVDFLENGNIRNSVNYPACDMGMVDGPRVAICHKNIPNMIGQFTSHLAAEGVNIPNMINKSRGDYAYSLLDMDVPATQAVIEKLESIKGVLKVRVVK